VRILGEGQLHIDDEAVSQLNELDVKLEAAVEHDNQAEFTSALAALHEKLREIGTPAKPDELEPSSLILPPADATMDDLRKLLADDGLIPG